MRDKDKLLELAKANDIPTTQRHFIDTRDGRTTFIDLPRPIKDLRDELIAVGALVP